MNESQLEVGKPRPCRLAGLSVLALSLGVSCSSTSQTNVIAAQGGSNGLGGSTAENGGAAGGQAGGASTGCR